MPNGSKGHISASEIFNSNVCYLIDFGTMVLRRSDSRHIDANSHPDVLLFQPVTGALNELVAHKKTATPGAAVVFRADGECDQKMGSLFPVTMPR
jgi:small ligand-binding sensory domain FIST